MATTIMELVARLTADTSNFDSRMRGAETGMQKTAKGIHKSALFAGAAIAGGLGVAAKIGWDEFAQGQKIAAQTNAVIKSTGGIANVTAKDVDSLATSIMLKSGVDDEAIASGENMLLTFKNLRNESGKGNDIFNQTTQIMTDMTAALHSGTIPSGEQMQQTSIRLGKALNDPIKGISALTRVGVTFTDAQKETIKGMVESGNVMGAQKMILKELNSEFGGSAEAAGKTLPGQLKILRERFNNFMGDLTAKVIPKILALTGFFGKHTTVLKVVAGAVATLTVGIIALSVALKLHTLITNEATKAMAKFLLALLTNPIFLIIAAIVALGVALVVAYKKSETFRNIVNGAFGAVRDAVRTVISNILGRIDALLGGLQSVMEAASHIPGVGDKFKGIAEKIGGARDRVQELRDQIDKTHGKTVAVKVNFKFYAKSWQYGWSSDALHGQGDIAGADALRHGIQATAGPGIQKAIQSLSFKVGGAPVKDIDQRLWGEIGMGRSMGLSVASGYRPGATVAGSGSRSDHSYFPSKAVDMAGSPFNMARFAHAIAGSPGVDTIIYSPIGLWKAGAGWGGIRSATTKSDHYDHVHVDTFDRGGWLKPGLTLAANWTGKPERVGGGGNVYITQNIQGHVVRERDLVRYLREIVKRGAADGIFLDAPQPGF